MINYKVFKPFRIIKNLGKIGLLSLLCISNLFPLAEAKDATSFNPVPIVVQATSGGVPIGTIAVWSRAELPDGWLECNGQSIPSEYDELHAIVGNRTPDYRGVFLRGVGGNSAGLGTKQGDAIRNIKGELYSHHWGTSLSPSGFKGRGAFVDGPNAHSMGVDSPDGKTSPSPRIMNFDASAVVPTANENRPVNMAVKYIIKAE